jgi:hypothetical protein
VFGRRWYEVQLRVQGVNGHGATWRGVFNDSSHRTARKFAEGQQYPYRIVKTIVVHEDELRVGLAEDHLMALGRKQGRAEVLDDLDGVVSVMRERFE